MTETMSLDEYRSSVKGRSRSKYGNKKVKRDGYTFDSKAEAARYAQLKLLVRSGEIRSLKVHPPFELIPAFKDYHGKRQRKTTYEADFSYREKGKRTLVVEDVKGVQTDTFKLKWKLLQHKYPKYDCRIIEAK